MADAHGNESKEGIADKTKKKVSEWREIIRNRIIKFPIIKRFKIGRRKVGGRQHPLFYELEKTWIEKNDQLFDNNLVIIEKGWDGQAELTGLPKPGSKIESSHGVVPLYYRLGAYNDKDRVESEVVWFEHGTGLDIQNISFDLKEDSPEAKKFSWNKDRVKEVLTDPSKPWKEIKYKRLDLISGKVYHEGKREFEEEIYVFGHTNLDLLAQTIKDFNKEINLEGLQESQIPVEIRTKFGNLSTAIEELLKGMNKIEDETFNELNKLKGEYKVYDSYWEDLYAKNSTETKNIAIIRFPHTYRIIKQNVPIKIEEKIIEKDFKERLVREYKRERTVIATLEYKDIYEEEEEKLRLELNAIKKERDYKFGVVDKSLKSVKQLKDDKDLFKKYLGQVINANKKELTDIIESSDETGEKITKIKAVVSHSDPAVDEIFEESINAIENELAALIDSGKLSTSKKIEGLQEAILNSLTSEAIVGSKIKSSASGIINAFTPVYKDESDKEIPKDKTRMYDELIGAIFTQHSTISKVFADIFKNNMNFIVSLIKLGKDAQPDKSYKEFADFIAGEIKKNNVMNFGLLIKLESLEMSREAIKYEYEEKMKSANRRLTEISNIQNKEEIRSLLKRENDGLFKRPEEVAIGLDEYGRPPEISPEKGEVLIDRWWIELSQNTWQLERIASKKGGAEMLKTHLGLSVNFSEPEGKRVSGTSQREQRVIKDKRFYGYLDLLEASCLIFSYWDAVRDDLRDGRYHPWSKSIADYLIEGEGGFDEELCAPYTKNWATALRNKG